MDTLTDPAQLDGWIPIRLYQEDEGRKVDWCHVGHSRFSEPFFDQTLDSHLRRPFNLLFRHQTPIELLGELAELRPGIEPDGFIFHMSRCGSTLLAQILAAVPENIVISEAGVIDAVIRAQPEHGESEAKRVEWLRWIVNALAQPRAGTEKNFFIKFDAWNILSLPLVRQAFPKVPWIFLYRDPVEVLVSQLARRGAHMVPGAFDPQMFGLKPDCVTTLPPEEYCARVLASLCEAGLRYQEMGGRLLNYSQLPEAAVSSVFPFFKYWPAENDWSGIRKAMQADAKNPSLVFEKDSLEKQSKATEPIRRVAERWLYPIYERLEIAREKQQ